MQSTTITCALFPRGTCVIIHSQQPSPCESADARFSMAACHNRTKFANSTSCFVMHRVVLDNLELNKSMSDIRQLMFRSPSRVHFLPPTAVLVFIRLLSAPDLSLYWGHGKKFHEWWGRQRSGMSTLSCCCIHLHLPLVVSTCSKRGSLARVITWLPLTKSVRADGINDKGINDWETRMMYNKS